MVQAYPCTLKLRIPESCEINYLFGGNFFGSHQSLAVAQVAMNDHCTAAPLVRLNRQLLPVSNEPKWHLLANCQRIPIVVPLKVGGLQSSPYRDKKFDTIRKLLCVLEATRQLAGA